LDRGLHGLVIDCLNGLGIECMHGLVTVSVEVPALLQEVEVQALAQVPHKVGGLVNGATAGRCLVFVHGQEYKIAIAQGCRSPQVLLMGGPALNKSLQGRVDEVGIQRYRRGKYPKPRGGR